MEHIKLIIWDMDGVKYVISDLFQARYTEAVARAASKLIPDMSFENAHDLAKKSKIETSKSMRVFVDNYGLDYLTLGQAADPEVDISILEPSHAFIAKLRQTDVDHVLLTEGNPAWTERILSQVQLKEFYADRHRITKADYPDYTKRSSRYPFELALQRSGHQAKNTLMVEDTPENLYHPKDMGMTTVLIDPFDRSKKNDTIDYIYRSPEEFLDAFNSKRGRLLPV